MPRPCSSLSTYHHLFLRCQLSISDSYTIMSYKDKACKAVQLAISYNFKDNNLLLEALDTTGMRTNESNQRLAMLGDALLKMILLDSWYAGGTAKGSLLTEAIQQVQWFIGRRAWEQPGLHHWQQCQPGHRCPRCWHRSACHPSPWTHWQSVRQNPCNDHRSHFRSDLPRHGQGYGGCQAHYDPAWAH
jgi:hypothetical protein